MYYEGRTASLKFVVWHIRDGQQASHTKARRTKNEKPSEDAFFPESV
jgi:hypothetical protein